MGLILGRYELIRRLAVGGMGEVFLARQVGVGGFSRLAIVKTLLPELAASHSAVQDFLDEGRLAAILNHPNVVSVFDVGEHEGTYFIAMEYVEGVDVAALRRAAAARGLPIPFPLIARMGADAARGLQHAHTQRVVDGQSVTVVHRDISPQNLMLRLDGVTKVVDFGIAKVSSRGSRTATGQVKGKVRYLAPEQLTERGADARSDQYALGIVLWELATGRPLYDGLNEFMMMQKIAREQVPAPRSIVAQVPPKLDGIIRRMVANDRNDRFPTCAAAADAIDQYLAQEADVSGPTAVSGWLRGLVGAEIEARTADLAPVAAIALARPPPAAPRASTNTTTIISNEARVRSRTPLIAAALAALAAVLALATALVVVRGAPAPPPEVVIVAQPPAPAPLAEPTPQPAAPEPPAPALPAAQVPAPAAEEQRPAKQQRRKVEVELRAPPFVQWRNRGDNLGKGDVRVKLSPNVSRVTAVDNRPGGGTSEVPVDGGVADWRALGDGKITFRVLPFAEVFVGNRALGLTPVAAQTVPAGVYAVRLVYKDKVERKTIVVRANGVSDVVHDFR